MSDTSSPREPDASAAGSAAPTPAPASSSAAQVLSESTAVPENVAGFEDQPRGSFGAVLGIANFYRLWMGQIISAVGDRFYQFALLGVVLGIDMKAVGQESAQVIFCGMLPGLLFAPIYGWVIDTFERRSVMIFTDVARAAIAFGFFAAWFLRNDMIAVLIFIFFMGAMNGLFIPARQASVPQLVPANRLVTANALISLIGMIGSLVGTIIASLIVALFGARSSFVITGIGFLVSAWYIWRIDRPLRPDAGAPKNETRAAAEVPTTMIDAGGFWASLTKKVRRSIAIGWKEVSAGAALVASRRELAGLVCAHCVFAFTGGAFLITVLEHTVRSVDLTLLYQIGEGLAAGLGAVATFANQTFGFEMKQPRFQQIELLGFGILFTCIGLGLALGVALTGKSSRWSHWSGLPYAALFALGAAIYGFAFIPSFGWALLGCLLIGCLGSTMVIPIEARLQHEVDDKRSGRVFAFRNSATTVATLGGLAVNLDGRLLEWRGATALISDLGGIVMISALILMAWNWLSLRTFWSPQDSGGGR